MNQPNRGKIHLSDNIKGERLEFLNSEVCRHFNIEPTEQFATQYGRMYKCQDCGVEFGAVLHEAIRQSHIANQKPLTAADFDCIVK